MKIEKVYVTTPTLCKNGVTRPITRAYLETPCDICGQPMRIEKRVKGSLQKRSWTRWRCIDKICNHSKISEGEKDLSIRYGLLDKKLGILSPKIYEDLDREPFNYCKGSKCNIIGCLVCKNEMY